MVLRLIFIHVVGSSGRYCIMEIGRKKLKRHYRDMVTGWKPGIEKHDPKVQNILSQCWSDAPLDRPTIEELHSSLQALTPAQTHGGDASLSAGFSMSSAFEIASCYDQRGESLV